jgi:hypothetical protein
MILSPNRHVGDIVYKLSLFNYAEIVDYTKGLRTLEAKSCIQYCTTGR